MALLEMNDVGRRYDIRVPGGLFGRPAALHAVDSVSLSLAAGSTLGLVGESGSGKTTTARLALGFEPPTRGTVHFDGQPIGRRGSEPWRRLRQRMQMIYQDPLAALDRRMPALAQVMEPLTVFDIDQPSGRRERAAAALAEVGLPPDLQGRYPHQLSGGQRQRVVLARALVTEPALLVCDEPVSALDVSIQAQVINLLADVQQRRGVAMLFISHDLRVVRQIADRVAVMYLGRIVEEGEPTQLFARPAHPYTQALVSAIPSIRPAGDRAVQRIRLQGDPPNPIDRPGGCAFHPRCPIAVDRCATEAPVLRTAGAQRVACHQVAA